MKTKLLLLSALALFLSASAWAYDFEEDNIQYTITSFDDLTEEVSGLTDVNVTEVIIPETVEYRSRVLTVTSIGQSVFEGNSTLQNVTIPNTVTTISSKAFYNCTSLSQIALPEGLMEIEDYVFNGCSSLSQVTLPECLQSIGEYAFYGCTSLSTIAPINSLQSIGEYAFYDCSSLSQISLPETLQTLGNYAFSKSGLTSITFPESITSIPYYCFQDCTNLEEINLPSTLESIETAAFRNCSSLKALDIPNSVTDLGYYAFRGCSGLESLNVGTGLRYLCDYASSGSTVAEYYPLLWTGGPSEMESIILRDCTTSFSVRGYGNYRYYCTSGIPMFSNMNVGYYYVGRPLTDTQNWRYNSYFYFYMTVSQPHGTIQTLEIGGDCTDVPYFYQSVEYLILGENVETFTASNIYQGDIKGILCKSTTPPTLDGAFDNSTYLDVVLYVPKGSKEAYQAAEGWRSFWEIQELENMPPGYSPVESIVLIGQAEATGYYTLDGKKVSQPQRGVNIIRYSDGTARKVLVK